MRAESEVRQHNGVPWLFINGEPASPHWAYCTPERANSFTRAGIRILTFTFPRSREISLWWRGPGEYDFSTTRRLLDDFACSAPEAWLVPRIHFGYAEMDWFPDRYPEECALALRIDTGEPDRAFVVDGVTRMQHSMASEVWRALAGEALTALIEDCEAHCGDRIIGYHIGGGHTAEWFPWNVVNENSLDDYSEPMRRAFREFLRRKYGTDDGLRKAWHRAEVSLNSAAIPSPQRRANPDAGSFYDPATSRDIIDYQRCYGQETARSAVRMCRVAKDATQGRKITGVFHGYLMTFDTVLCPQRGGHLGFDLVLDSPHVDFVTSPYLYENRGWGGAHYAQSLPRSIQARGKLYVDEIDSPPFGEGKVSGPFARVRLSRKPDQWTQTLRRDWAYNAAMGTAGWWMDLIDAGWYGDEGSVEVLRELVRADALLSGRERGSAAEIAVVLDLDSHAAAAPGPSFQEPFIGFLVQWELARIGAPFDVVLLDDLLKRRAGPYRLLFVPQLAHITDETRTALRQYLNNSNSSVFWLHAPGFLAESDDISGYNMRALCGFNIAIERTTGHLDAAITSYGHWLTRGVAPGTSYGSSSGLADRQQVSLGWTLDATRIGPRATIVDDGVDVLARFETGGAVLAVRESDRRFDVLSTVPAPPTQVLRNAAERAGVHLYTPPGDVVYAGKSFLGVVAGSEGARTIRLPEESHVTDLLTGRVVVERGRSFGLVLLTHHCALFLVE
ncbi:MAG: beta-galactosidase [Verrucomicrobia bacterium]|nr:beta-galactosidase [Verrucomicrobiota bacterium]